MSPVPLLKPTMLEEDEQTDDEDSTEEELESEEEVRGSIVYLLCCFSAAYNHSVYSFVYAGTFTNTPMVPRSFEQRACGLQVFQ